MQVVTSFKCSLLGSGQAGNLEKAGKTAESPSKTGRVEVPRLRIAAARRPEPLTEHRAQQLLRHRRVQEGPAGAAPPQRLDDVHGVDAVADAFLGWFRLVSASFPMLRAPSRAADRPRNRPL